MQQDDEVKIEVRLSGEEAARVHRVSREMDVPWNEVMRRVIGFYLDAVDRERDDV